MQTLKSYVVSYVTARGICDAATCAGIKRARNLARALQAVPGTVALIWPESYAAAQETSPDEICCEI